jgi:hypothetical protein
MAPAWPTLHQHYESPMMRVHCYGYYCERKKLSIFCMFKCDYKDECMKSHKKLVYLSLFQFVSYIPNLLIVTVAPGLHTIVNAIACLSVIAVFLFETTLVYKATNKTLRALDVTLPQENY